MSAVYLITSNVFLSEFKFTIPMTGTVAPLSTTSWSGHEAVGRTFKRLTERVRNGDCCTYAL